MLYGNHCEVVKKQGIENSKMDVWQEKEEPFMESLYKK